MGITIEISYYPLTSGFSEPIDEFLELLPKTGMQIEVGTMSTLIIGEYSETMQHLVKVMGELMNKYPSVFTFKISNACTIISE